ncbi:hypothetical protein P389DRAFT_65519 [Cystobasidium minutum MCA 4210]|uniref:uncharacterized protein n=1 Tax=Cystobasidium minutum MCA 4210 TaxID=1397322 RepID=UPI0034CF57B8|eukprot:jgi/Rhomi1/65519/CE65518_54
MFRLAYGRQIRRPVLCLFSSRFYHSYLENIKRSRPILRPPPTSMKFSILTTFFTLAALSTQAVAGPALYGICQSGCASVVCACYSAAGFTFGTVVAGPATPAVILACNSAFGACSAKCALVTMAAPTLVTMAAPTTFR